MATDYAGTNIFPATITVLDDLDLKNAASVAVPLEQLADRTAYLNALIMGGANLEFTDATFHGTTTFADGTIAATLTAVVLTTANDIELQAAQDIDLLATQDINIEAVGSVVFVAAEVDMLNGVAIVSPTSIQLNASVMLGGGAADTVGVQGTFSALHNATFAAAKTLALNGATTAADLRAVVSNAAGLEFTGAGQPKWRTRQLGDADVSGSVIAIGTGSGGAEIFYIDSLTVAAEIRLGTGQEGNVIAISFVGASLAAPIDIKNAAGSLTLLANCTATVKPYSQWLCLGGTSWRLLTPAP